MLFMLCHTDPTPVLASALFDGALAGGRTVGAGLSRVAGLSVAAALAPVSVIPGALRRIV